MAIFILAHISRQGVNNCPRRSQGQLSTEGFIQAPTWKQPIIRSNLTK